MKKKRTAKRICALALSFVVALTMIPLMGAGAYAKESRDLDPAILEAAEEAGIDTDDQETVRAFADALDEQGITPDTLDIKAIDDIPEDAEPLKKADGEPVDPENIPAVKKESKEKKLAEEEDYEASIEVSLNKATGIATVTGTVTGDTFYDIYVDDSACYAGIDGEFAFTREIDMKEYDVGLHTIHAELNDHNDAKVYYDKAVPTYIYSKPSNKISFFTTGPNYFIYSYGGSSYSYDYDCGIGLDYRKKGGAWKTGYGPYSTSTAVKMTKMKSGKAYQVRTYFAKKFTYGGKGYYITGKNTGKTGKTVTIKTGGKKLRVKSLKITKAKQYSKKYTLITWIYIGGYRYPRTTTYKYWYTDFKITLRLKKKPGALGVCIGSKRVKGNKKKYTTTMHFSGKQKGKKLKFELCSYQSKVYKGYSKSVYKKVKVK